MVMLVWLKDYNVKRLHKVRGVRLQTADNNAVLLCELNRLAKAVTAIVVAHKEPVF